MARHRRLATPKRCGSLPTCKTASTNFSSLPASTASRNEDQVRHALDADPDTQELAASLYREDPKLWDSLKPDEELAD